MLLFGKWKRKSGAGEPYMFLNITQKINKINIQVNTSLISLRNKEVETKWVYWKKTSSIKSIIKTFLCYMCDPFLYFLFSYFSKQQITNNGGISIYFDPRFCIQQIFLYFCCVVLCCFLKKVKFLKCCFCFLLPIFLIFCSLF